MRKVVGKVRQALRYSRSAYWGFRIGLHTVLCSDCADQAHVEVFELNGCESRTSLVRVLLGGPS
jgi:hypothetical protein